MAGEHLKKKVTSIWVKVQYKTETHFDTMSCRIFQILSQSLFNHYMKNASASLRTIHFGLSFKQLGAAFEAEESILFIWSSYDAPLDWLANWTCCAGDVGFLGVPLSECSLLKSPRKEPSGSSSTELSRHPCFLLFFWIIIFGGTVISKERDWARHGLCCPGPNHFLVVNLDKLSVGRNLDTIVSSLNYS